MARTKLPHGPALHVHVTPEIIAAAKRGDSGYCMLAEAVKIAFPDVAKGKNAVSVDLQTIRVSDAKKNLRYVFLTPRMAQVALVDFDQGSEVEPFSFRLRGAHVMNRPFGGSEAAKERAKKGARASALARATMREESKIGIPIRVGGKPPPLQKTADGVPYSRRREFGLRALRR
jgi:hypothetical protein